MALCCNNHSRFCLFLFLIFVVPCNNLIFAQVAVNIEIPPPFRFKIEDLWKITLSNSSSSENVYLYGTIESLDKGTLLAEARSSVFNLPAGVKRITASEITPVDLTKHTNEVEETIEKIGTLPNGEYLMCIYVFSVETNEIIGSTCLDVSVLSLTQPELLSPQDEEIVLDIFPAFNWFPAVPLPVGSDVSYELIIVEIMERQTPEYALISNPPWFWEKEIRNNLFRYPLGARPLSDGQRYAWQLKTYVNGNLLSESEIREFTFENINSELKERNERIKKQIETELQTLTAGEEVLSLNENEGIYLLSMRENNEDEFLPSGLSVKNQYSSVKNELSISDIIYTEPGNSGINLIKETKPFEFLGSYGIEYQYSNLKGIGSEIPKNYLNLRLNPTMVIYGVPLSFSMFYSTQQRGSLQNVNSLSILLDQGYLKKIGREEAREKIMELENEVDKKKSELEKQKENLSPESIEKLNAEINKKAEELDELKKNPEKHLPGSQGFFANFNTLGIGTNYPKYTSYTVDGARVTGLNLEMNPAWLYFAFTGWQNLDAIPNSTYSRNLLAGSLGGGSKDGSHIHFTVMKAQDDQNSLTASQVPGSITPQENIVFGTDASLNLFNNYFSIGGEVDASVFTRDVNSPELQSDDVPEFIKNFTSATMSTQMDYAYELFTSLDLKDTDTKIKGSYKLVGPGYISMGAPGIRRDVKGFSVKLNQILFNRVVSFSAAIAREQNNLISQSISTSTYYKYAFNFKMNIPNAPYLVIDYRPNFISNDLNRDSLKLENNAHVFSVMTGYNLIESIFTSATNLVVTYQSSTSNLGNNDLSLFNITLSENISFVFPLFLTGSLGFINTDPANFTTVIVDFSTGYTFFNLWRNSVGVNYSRESDRSKRTGIYFNSSIKLWELGNLNISVQQNFYREDILIYGNRNEFLLRAGITKRI